MEDHFQHSLKSTALRWFLNVKAENCSTWDQISEIFLEKYRANLEWETNRHDLQAAEQKNDELVGEFYWFVKQLGRIPLRNF